MRRSPRARGVFSRIRQTASAVIRNHTWRPSGLSSAPYQRVRPLGSRPEARGVRVRGPPGQSSRFPSIMIASPSSVHMFRPKSFTSSRSGRADRRRRAGAGGRPWWPCGGSRRFADASRRCGRGGSKRGKVGHARDIGRWRNCAIAGRRLRFRDQRRTLAPDRRTSAQSGGS